MNPVQSQDYHRIVPPSLPPPPLSSKCSPYQEAILSSTNNKINKKKQSSPMIQLQQQQSSKEKFSQSQPPPSSITQQQPPNKSSRLADNLLSTAAATSHSLNDSKSNNNRLSTTTTTTINKKSSSKNSERYSPSLNNSYNRKIDNSDNLGQKSLIVSIELPKLNRIPHIDRNGNHHLNHEQRMRSASPIPPPSSQSSRNSKSDLKKQQLQQQQKSSQQRLDNEKLSNLNGKSIAGSQLKLANKINKISDTTTTTSAPPLSSSNSKLNKPVPSPISSSTLSSSLPVSIPINNINNSLRTSPHITNNNNNHQHNYYHHNSSTTTTTQRSFSPLCSTEQEAQSMARTLKRKADSIKIPQQQILQYIEASMYFIQSGLIMEQKRIESEIDKAYQLYRDTLQLIKVATAKLSKQNNRPSTLLLFTNQEQLQLIDLKLTVLSYRCQALINSRLTRMRYREIHENKEMIGQFFKTHEKILNSCQNPPSSNSLSNQSSSSSTTTMSVPIQMMNYISRQLFLLQQSYSANDLWIKSESMIETNQSKNECKEFFQKIDHEAGLQLQLSSSLEQLIHYTLKGVKIIQECLQPLLANNNNNNNNSLENTNNNQTGSMQQQSSSLPTK
ncbi:Has a role in transcriptional regulation [Dermatophagoides pteronyssinus]|uniref:AF4/FMR2 family member lilli n=1 Tax=Dermatophagoides pteronyssinus TaxID=6956 RepID=A0ABQ8J455_DERPT|nr:Has a role in transcriptional regulation [Dermatophagoides pteronyssinus]